MVGVTLGEVGLHWPCTDLAQQGPSAAMENQQQLRGTFGGKSCLTSAQGGMRRWLSNTLGLTLRDRR